MISKNLSAIVVPLMTAGILSAWSGASAHQFKFHTLYSFCAEASCADGAGPLAALIMDQSGNLYGTTQGGGALAHGTVFRLSPRGANKWKHATLYSFCSQSATCPSGGTATGVIIDTSGNLYGTTDQSSGADGGIIFELKPREGEWKYKQLYAFPCSGDTCPDGSHPSGLAYLGAAAGQPYDGTSPLFGSASGGGTGGAAPQGVVFKLEPVNKRWRQRVLYNFCSALSGDCADGSLPFGTPVVDGTGRLFGTTEGGGATGSGTVYSLNGTSESVIYSFCPAGSENCVDGMMPVAPVFLDNFGHIVGTTGAGGVNGPNGDGTLFTVSGAGEQVLYSFCSKANCSDGLRPTAGVIEDSAGDIFGVTAEGGNDNGDGVLFEYRDGTMRVLHTFGGGADGCGPVGGLIIDASGNLYGTTSGCGIAGGGTLFELEKRSQ